MYFWSNLSALLYLLICAFWFSLSIHMIHFFHFFHFFFLFEHYLLLILLILYFFISPGALAPALSYYFVALSFALPVLSLAIIYVCKPARILLHCWAAADLWSAFSSNSSLFWSAILSSRGDHAPAATHSFEAKTIALLLMWFASGLGKPCVA